MIGNCEDAQAQEDDRFKDGHSEEKNMNGAIRLVVCVMRKGITAGAARSLFRNTARSVPTYGHGRSFYRFNRLFLAFSFD